jgi:hypothetical protein
MQRRFNWPLWTGLLLSVAAFGSYFAFFVNFPATRDIPWASYALFVLAIGLVVLGWRRAPKKILATIVAVLAVAIAGFFAVMISSTKGLPASAHAPAPGQRAPDFTLVDSAGRQVTLSNALAGSKGVLLVFYRGFW